LKFRKAKIDKDIRRQPSHYNLDKPTNEAVMNITILDAEYKNLNNMLIEAKYFVDVLFGVIISIDHRRDALANEVKLFLNNYYAEQEMPNKTKKKLDKIDDEKYDEEHIRKMNENRPERVKTKQRSDRE
jgi:hypothetical protein